MRSEKKRYRSDDHTSPHPDNGPDEYLDRIMSGVRLSHKETALLRSDVREALDYMISEGLSAGQAYERIGCDIFGRFYTEPDRDEWYPLDSAAKIYPLSMTRQKMSIYRIAANMTDPVVPQLLRLALHSTIKRFPTFATILKRGLFWHYLDARRKRFVIEPETEMPCAPIKLSTRNDQVFRVIYFRNRISMEVFHCVADGYGAMFFFRTLLAEYLRLKGYRIPQSDDIADINSVPDSGEFEDSFGLTDDIGETVGYGQGQAIHISGKRTNWQPAQVLHFVMPARSLVAAAKKEGTTVSGLILAAMMLAAKAAYRGEKKDGCFKVQLPVDMRQHYPSKTLRNFSMYAIIKVPYSSVGNLCDVVPIINDQMRTETGKESLDRMAAMTKKLVANPAIRFIPLGLKRIIISRIAHLATGKSFTGVLSNIGLVRTDFAGGIESFEAVSGPSRSNQIGCALVSHRDTAVLSVTKHTMDHSFECKLYDVLSAMDINITVEGNEP